MPIALLAVIPAFRITGLLVAPFVTLPDVTWILAIAAIPGVMLWCLLFGIASLRGASRASAGHPMSVAPTEGAR